MFFVQDKFDFVQNKDYSPLADGLDLKCLFILILGMHAHKCKNLGHGQ